MKQDLHQKLKPGSYYHIYNRGNNKETIFKERINYYYFLKLWWRYTNTIAKTYCYSLLPNHFHFFLRIEDNVKDHSASKALSNVFNAYAKAINKKYDRTGSLFQERFKRKEITDDNYFTHIIFYILTNPTKHGICKKANKYEFSAYHQILSDKITPIMREAVLQWFTDKKTFIQLMDEYERTLKPNRCKT